MPKKHYQPIEYCGTTCLGLCCKSMPGNVTPKDIQNLFPAKTLEESVILALESGKFAIDWHEGDHPLYYIRPATKEAYKFGLRANEWLIYNGSWGGACIFLETKGCTLSYEQRPENCKAVKPSSHPGGCHMPYSQNPKVLYARVWRRHIDLRGFDVDHFKVQREEDYESEKCSSMSGL